MASLEAVVEPGDLVPLAEIGVLSTFGPLTHPASATAAAIVPNIIRIFTS
jgi:hypothetical protein